MEVPITEAQVETQIEQRLKNLGWNLDYNKPSCNVYKQTVKTEQEKKALGGKRPDYVLYDDNGKPLIVIEVKRPHADINQARKQGIGYAKPLKAPIVFATTGSYTTSWHVTHNRPLELNKSEVKELLSLPVATNYRDKHAHFTENERVIKSKEELLTIFKHLNNHFKEAGIPAGRSRIELFCNFLFLKLISELTDEKKSIIQPIPDWAKWENFTKKHQGESLYNFINKTAYDHFKKAYGGEVLSPIKVNADKYDVLDKMVASLDGLILNSIQTDIKGDAFEYFLRNYGGAETDFGEYFTPRHIVEAMVALLDPKIGERVYDPFCGTGGMLTYVYKHIYNSMAKTPAHIDQLKEEAVYGGELTDMSRVAKMNMILAGDGQSNIKQQDSYATPQRGKYDVVITNMPFGNKMKTPHANLYGYNTKSAEVVGVLHCLDALKDSPDPRAGIIVPEGILFNRNKAYKDLRRQLVENYHLEKIISLPPGVFGVNTKVKSNMLIIKKQPQKTTKHIWYFTVKNDGFTLDAHRRKRKGTNDLDIVASEKDLDQALEDTKVSKRLKKLGFSLLYKDKIKAQDYILVPGHYQTFQRHTKYEMVTLENICTITSGHAFKSKLYKTTGIRLIKINNVQRGYINRENFSFYQPDSGEKINPFSLQENDLAVTLTGNIGRVALIPKDLLPALLNQRVGCIRIHDKKVSIKYLFHLLNNDYFINWCHRLAKGSAQKNLSTNQIKRFELPLPPLEEQKKIVAEIAQEEAIIAQNRILIEKMNKKIQTKINALWETAEKTSL